MSNETIAIVADAAEKKAQAEETRDTLLASVGDTKTRAVVKLLADAAIAGVQVKKVEMALAAENENDACAQAFVKMQLDAGLGACDVTTASSTSASTRRLHATATFSVTVFVNPKRSTPRRSRRRSPTSPARASPRRPRTPIRWTKCEPYQDSTFP
tara:strand:- start:316 stop:783 length:468 start_codon:yes stop_codon:yes gene_type:complete